MKLVNALVTATLYLSCFAQGEDFPSSGGVRRKLAQCTDVPNCKDGDKCVEVIDKRTEATYGTEMHKDGKEKAFCGIEPSYDTEHFPDAKGKEVCYKKKSSWVIACDNTCYEKTGDQIDCPTSGECPEKDPHYEANGKCYKVKGKKGGKNVYIGTSTGGTYCWEKDPKLTYDTTGYMCLEKKKWFACEKDKTCWERKKKCTGQC